MGIGGSSALIPGTPYYEKARGKQMIYMNQDQAEKVDQLTRKYGKMMGFR